MSNNIKRQVDGAFKFLTFAEQIKSVNLDIFRSGKHLETNLVPLGVNETYFQREVERLRLSADFSFMPLYHALRPWIVSLPMILYRIKDIVKALLRFIDAAKPELISELLKLLSILSRDMRSEFYVYFDIVLKCLISKIDAWRTSADLTEALFSSLALHFKYLEPYLVKDIFKVFLIYQEFFLSKKEYVRQFAGESFAYLLRKQEKTKFSQTLDFILQQIPEPSADPSEQENRTKLMDGVGFLLFSAIQGIKGKLTISAADFIPLYFSKLSLLAHPTLDNDMDVEETNPEDKDAPTFKNAPAALNRTSVDLHARYSVLSRLVTQVRAHLKSNDSEVLWNAITEPVKTLLQDHTRISSEKFKSLGYLFSLAAQWIERRHLSEYSSENQESFMTRGLTLINVVLDNSQIFNNVSSPELQSHVRETLDRFANNFCVSFLTHMANEQGTVMPAMARKNRSIYDRLFVLLEGHAAVGYDLTLSLQSTSLFKQMILPVTLQFIEKQTTSLKLSPADLPKEMLQSLLFVYTLIRDLDWGTMIGATNISIASKSVKFATDTFASQCLSILKHLNISNATDHQIAILWVTLKVISHLHVQSQDKITQLAEAITEQFKALLKQTSANTMSKDKLYILLGDALNAHLCLSKMCGSSFEELSRDLLKETLAQALDLAGAQLDNHYLILSLSEMVNLALSEPYGKPLRYKAVKEWLWTKKKDTLATLVQQVSSFVGHFSILVRTASWNLLKSIVDLRGNEQDGIEMSGALVNLCHELINSHIDPLSHKAFSSKFTTVAELACKPSAKPFDRALAIRFLIGVYYTQLVPLWAPATAALGILHDFDTKTFWSLFLPLIESLQTQISTAHVNAAAQEEEQEEDAMQVDEEESLEDSLFLLKRDQASIETCFSDVYTATFRFTSAATLQNSIWDALTKHAAKSLQANSATATALFDLFLTLIDEHFPNLDDPFNMQAMNLADKEEKPAGDPTKTDKAAPDVDEESEPAPQVVPKAVRESMGAIRRSVLLYVTFIAALKNMNGAKKADRLFDVFSKLIASSNESVQVGCLKCLCLWKEVDYITPYKSKLERLITHGQNKASYSELPLSPAKTVLAAQHRPSIIPLIIRILIPKLSFNKDDRQRRLTVLSYLAHCSAAELAPLFDLTLVHFAKLLETIPASLASASSTTPSKKKSQASITVEGQDLPVSAGALQATASFLQDALKSMGLVLGPYIQNILAITLFMIQRSHAFSIDSKDRRHKNVLRDVRKLALRNLSALMAYFETWNYAPFKKDITRLMMMEANDMAAREAISPGSSLFHWLTMLSANPTLLHFLPPFVPFIISSLKRPSLSAPVRSEIYTILENLLKAKTTEVGPAPTPVKSAVPLIAGLTAKQRSKMSPAALSVHDTEYYLLEGYKASEDVLLPHSNELLEAMELRVLTDYGDGKRKTLSKGAPRELILLEKMASFATDSTNADRLVSLLLPYALAPRTYPDVIAKILSFVAGMVPLMTKDAALAQLPHINALFRTLSDAESRSKLVDVFLKLSQLDPILSTIVTLIAELNSMDAVDTNLPDYDRRGKAYTKINEELLPMLTRQQLEIVTSNYLNFACDKDISIRNNASFGLERIMKRIADDNVTEPKKASKSKAQAQNTIPLDFVTDFLFGEIIYRTSSPVELTRKEFLALFNTMILTFKTSFAEYLPASHEEEELNVFLSLHHMQTTRRVKALNRLQSLVESEELSMEACLKLFYPVLRQMLLGSTMKDNSVVDLVIFVVAAIAKRLPWTEYDRMVRQAFSGAKAETAIRNQWIKLLCTLIDAFHFEMNKTFKEVVRKTVPKSSKFKIVSEHEGGFSEQQNEAFADRKAKEEAQALRDDTSSENGGHDAEEQDESNESGSEAGRENGENGENGELEHADDISRSDDASASESEDSSSDIDSQDGDSSEDEEDYSPEDEQQKQIQLVVLRSYLPGLMGLLKVQKKEHTEFRQRVAVSSVSLLTRMSEEAGEPHIRRIVVEVSSQIASRAMSVRTTCSAIIQDIMKVIGPNKFVFLMEILTAQLRRGFELHSLCSVTNKLLAGLKGNVAPGIIDDGLNMLMKIIFEELLGQTAEQKTVSKFKSKNAEAAQTFAYSSLAIICELINFEQSIKTIMHPIFDVILATSDMKLVRKMQQALTYANLGAHANPTATTEQLCIFIYQLTEQYGVSKKLAPEAPKSDMERTWVVELNPYRNCGIYAVGTAAHAGTGVDNEHFIVAYALELLGSLLKRSLFNTKEPEKAVALLDPFVPIVSRFVKSRFDDVLTAALKTLTGLLKYNLPSINGRAKLLAEAVIHLLQKSGVQSKLLKNCFQCLTRILNFASAELKLADNLYSLVVGLILEVLNTDLPQHGLELLLAIIKRRVLLPEVYDSMKRINELLVSTIQPSVRTPCEQIISTFILTYPLEQKRLDQQFEFIMANLSCPRDIGRYAIMELLKTIFIKFPEQVINEKMQYFFLPLVAQMVNDENEENRGMAATTIDSLFSRVSHENAEQLLQLTLKWYESDDAKVSLQRAAAQLLTLFAERIGAKKYETHLKRLLPTFNTRLEQVTQAFDEEEMEQSVVYATDDQWQAVYFTMLLIEKSLTLVPSYVAKSSFISIWRRLCSPQILAFPHPWVKLLAARLLGLYFAMRKEQMPIKPQLTSKSSPDKAGSSAADLLGETRKLFSITKLFCLMLSSPDLSEELGTQVVKNLYWLVLQLQAFPELTPLQQVHASKTNGDSKPIQDDDEHDSDQEEDHPKEKNAAAMDVDDDNAPDGGSDDESGSDEDENAESEGEEQGNKTTEASKKNPAVEWVFRRMSYMARGNTEISRSSIFKFFAAVGMGMEVAEVQRYLIYMLPPLYRANEIIARTVAKRAEVEALGKNLLGEDPQDSEYAHLVHQVAELLKTKVGTSFYFQIHERVRGRTDKSRRQKKAHRAVQAVINPQATALRKITVNKKRKEAKKRKMDDHHSQHARGHRIKLSKHNELD